GPEVRAWDFDRRTVGASTLSKNTVILQISGASLLKRLIVGKCEINDGGRLINDVGRAIEYDVLVRPPVDLSVIQEGASQFAVVDDADDGQYRLLLFRQSNRVDITQLHPAGAFPIAAEPIVLAVDLHFTASVNTLRPVRDVVDIGVNTIVDLNFAADVKLEVP